MTAPAELHDACAPLDEMRLIKDAHELELIRRACAISARAHIRAMQRSAAMLRQGQDAREHHLEAELLHEFRQSGAEFPAYGNIVASGANACVLHYPAGSAPVRLGDMVLIDAGCELHGYASDITRSFPASGRFTAAQRALYDVVLAMQQAAIDATRPGARFNEPHEAAVRTLTQGLFDLGILTHNQHGSVQDAVAARAYAPYYMHRTSHWMGMDVHDMEALDQKYVGYDDEIQPSTQFGTSALRMGRRLEKGFVVTDEPGIYFIPDLIDDWRAKGHCKDFLNFDRIETYKDFGGIRLEDDVLITDNGCRMLGKQIIPYHPKDVEEYMAKHRV